jgi:transposase-like protein
MVKREEIRYSEAFKLQVVKALESGEVSGVTEARAKFGVAGAVTVQSWVRKYGRGHLLPKVVRVEVTGESDRLRELKKQNERLKKALADSHMETLLYRGWFEMACREGGIQDVEGFKKKAEGGSSR